MFNQDDFLLLENIILKTSGERIKSKVQQFEMEEDRYLSLSSQRLSTSPWSSESSWQLFSQGQRPGDEGGCSALLSAQRRGPDRIRLRRRSLQVQL